MTKRYICLIAVFMAISFVFIPPVYADTGRYIVKAIPPDEITGEFYDPMEISFWQFFAPDYGNRARTVVFPVACIPD